MIATMERDSKLGYGFLFVGTGLPYLTDKLLGPVTALCVAAVVLIAGVSFLFSAHHKAANGRSLHMTIWVFTLYGAGLGALGGGITGAIAHLKSASVPPKSDHAVVKKVTDGPPLKLLFKNAAMMTSTRQANITNAWSECHHYLVSLGFDPPEQIPPIGIITGNQTGSMWNLTKSWSIYDQELFIADTQVDDKYALVKFYLNFVFTWMFHVAQTPMDENPNQMIVALRSAYLFADYFTGVYLGWVDMSRSLDGEWAQALLQIRKEFGASFTDQAILYTYKTFKQPKPDEADFNKAFSYRFLHGAWIADNNGERNLRIQQILASWGLFIKPQ